MDDDESRHIKKHIHQVLYESIKYLKRTLIWDIGSIQFLGNSLFIIP
jgi:hypothetical protein